MLKTITKSPARELSIIGFVSLSIIFEFLFPKARILLIFCTVIGAIPTMSFALKALYKRKITIDVLNSFILFISFTLGEYRSASFIVLMLAFANLLEWKTTSRARHAVEELMRLKPDKAVKEIGDTILEVPAEEIVKDDVVVVEDGTRVPIDGVVIYGSAYINESSVTGESKPVHKVVGDRVISSTLNESGVIKVKATHVGEDSTIQKMAKLVKEAARNKSKSEKLADHFAAWFMPVLLVMGGVTYLITRNIHMTTALFLVACADDMAVSIPLAMTAALGRAAKRGVIIKGGVWLEAMGKMKTLILDKTGTLTYGTFAIKKFTIHESITETDFWKYVGIAEKYSEHPAGRAIFHRALEKNQTIPDPDANTIIPGSGIVAKFQNHEIIVGDYLSLKEHQVFTNVDEMKKCEEIVPKDGDSHAVVFLDQKYVGFLDVADMPRFEARNTIQKLIQLGVKNIVMFTGDTPEVAGKISAQLGIINYEASMVPEDKLTHLESWIKDKPVVMVGDGVNDAPALARANVGIAMGGKGTAVAVETADIVILTDDLSRIPELVVLGRDVFTVIQGNIIIWIVTNIVGFILVYTGIFGPVAAAFYNFIGDFLPIINSAKLFKESKKQTSKNNLLL